MYLKPARLALTSVSAIIFLISLTIAQDIGHLGVNTDPIPLVQVRRQRNFVARVNRNNSNSIAANRPNPASPNLTADISPMAGSGSKGGKPATPPPTGTPLPSASGTSTATVAVANNTVNPTAIAANAPKEATNPLIEAIGKAEDLVQKSDFRGAIEAYKQALNLDPTSVDARLGLADTLQDVKDYAGAEGEYKKITDQNPNSADARRGRADMLYELKRYDEAVAEYQAAIRAGANDAGTYNNLGNALFRTSTRDNRDKAIESYRKAIELNPKSSDAHAGLANVLRIQKRMDEARTSVEKAIELAPTSSLAHSVAGRVYADLRDFPRAVAEAQKAIELSPKDAFAHLNLAGIQFMQGQHDAAIRSYIAAQSYDRTWAVPHNSLGNLYQSINRPLEATEEFEIAAKLEPKNPTIHGNLGGAYLKLQKYDAAVQNLQIASQLDPKNTVVLSNLGLAYYRQGRYNEAVTAFQRAVELEPRNEMFHQAVVDTLNAAGRKKEAKEAFSRAEGMGIKIKKK